MSMIYIIIILIMAIKIITMFSSNDDMMKVLTDDKM